MEQRERIEGVYVKDAKKMKGKAVIGIAIAAVILASIFAAMVPIVSAASRGDNFNHIVVQQAPQKVLIGQNLQFEGFDGPVAIYRMVSGDIGNVYLADANNRIYNVNWPTEGAYYVGYDSATKDYAAQLSVEDYDMPLSLKGAGTNLIIDTRGMNLYPEDQVDLVVFGPGGQIKHDWMNDQQFTDITVAELTSNFGGSPNTLAITGWYIGTYTFQVKTDPENACGLEAESAVWALELINVEIAIAIEAETTSCIELQTVKLAVTGVPGDEIRVGASPLSKNVIFKEGIDDTPTGPDFHGNWFTDTIDADGIRKYALEFNDSGTCTIRVTVTGGDRWGDSDTVEITVSEKLVTFDMPPTGTIGENFTIRGTANIGATIDIAVDDYVYPLLNDLAIDDNGEFSVDIATAEIATFSDTGPVILTAYIDRAAGAGDAFEARDGTAKLFMLNDAGGGIAISASETRVGKNETIILAINAVPNRNVSVTTSDPAHTIFEYNRYDFTGTSNNIINIAPADTISIPADLSDCDSHTAAKSINGVWETMNADGILKFAVHFTDLGTYKITATDYGTGDPTATRLDAEEIEITVTKKNVTFDLPSVLVIGDTITIKGTVDTGTYVSVYVDDVLYRKLQNLVIADGEFRQEVKTTDVGMDVPGIVELKAYIDCDMMCGDPEPTGSDDGSVGIFMVAPWLTASLAPDSVDPEDDFTVSGSAPGSNAVWIVCVPPNGGGGNALTEERTGITVDKASVSTNDNKFTKKLTVQKDATAGYYDIFVLSPGMDGVWDMTGNMSLINAINVKYNIFDITNPCDAGTKTQDQVIAIFKDLTQTPGSDDLMQMLPLIVGTTDALILNPIADVVVGNQVNVSGETSRNDGARIWITLKSEDQMLAVVITTAMASAFNVTFDTTGFLPGTLYCKSI